MQRFPVTYLLLGLVVSLLVNLPALFAGAVWVRMSLTAFSLLMLGLVGVLLLRRAQAAQVSSSSMKGMVTGVATAGAVPVDGTALMRSLRRTHTVMRWWPTLVGFGILAGSFAGALAGPWMVQVLGGAFGFLLVEAILRFYAVGRFRRLSALAS